MKTNQPKYISYRGAKYERVNILNEIRVDPIPPPKYYAVFNYLGEYNNGVPLYIITNTKERMIDKLNKSYKEFTGETNVPYSKDAMEEPASYMGEPMDVYISDDWATVTYDESIFKNELKRVADHLEKQPEQYI